MIDDNGNIFTKFGTIADRLIVGENKKIEKGTKLRMCAEIKAHNEYRNNKETVLGRVSKFVEPKKGKK